LAFRRAGQPVVGHVNHGEDAGAAGVVEVDILDGGDALASLDGRQQRQLSPRQNGPCLGRAARQPELAVPLDESLERVQLMQRLIARRASGPNRQGRPHRGDDEPHSGAAEILGVQLVGENVVRGVGLGADAALAMKEGLERLAHGEVRVQVGPQGLLGPRSGARQQQRDGESMHSPSLARVLCRRKVNGHPPRPGAFRRAELRRRRTSAPLLLLVTLVSAGAFGVVLYIVSTSLPFLASSPSTDSHFGGQNQCLLEAVSPPRVGFAVSWEGSRVAGYSGGMLALCAPDGDAGTWPVHGIQQAAWDARGTLWLGTSQTPDGGWRLSYLADGGELASAGDFAPIALAGHATGAVALDASGKLVSLTRDGRVLGWAQLPAVPAGPVQLTTNVDGTLAAVVAGSGVFAFDTSNLKLLRAEAPCEVEFSWWGAEDDELLLSCGPESGFALTVHVRSGVREAAPRRQRVHSLLVPGPRVWVQPCEQLPCTAPAP
jgi:hypothetical protein